MLLSGNLPRKKKKNPFFWTLPQLGGTPYRNLFGHFFKSEKVAQKVCCEGDPLPKFIFTRFIFGAKTKVKKLPKLCAGVGEWGGVWAMPKRKGVFWEGFPYLSCPLNNTMQKTL